MLVSTDTIRSQFTLAMSAMYREEVPQYAKLLTLVNDVNQCSKKISTKEQDDLLNVERHGAIRLGTADELSTMRRLFAVMGMHPVDYYDLSIASIPVHSTAFRAIDLNAINISPFRVFTSLLRIDLIENSELRKLTKQLLGKRQIFSKALLSLITESEKNNGLTNTQAKEFIQKAIEVFRWHQDALVNKNTYEKLNQSHRLIADVVSFKGPHINHLTPKIYDIDLAQQELHKQGFKAKDKIEGPPLRQCPILLRQTSFLALQENIKFTDGKKGTHTARFGEIEQRGVALTPKGRALYDQLLQQAKEIKGDYNKGLEEIFAEFPDSHEALRKEELGYYHYFASSNHQQNVEGLTIEALVHAGALLISPILYEDFLPVSAAGIFQSNLSNTDKQETQHNPNKAAFERDLGAKVIDSFSLYETVQKKSLERALKQLSVTRK